MKKIFFSIITGILLFASSTNNEILQINGIKEFNVPINPNTIKTYFQVEIKNNRLSFIMNNISKISEKTKKHCKKMTYSFNPVYQYKNGEQIFKGYRAKIYLNCEFNKNKKNILSTLIDNISKYGNVKLSNIYLTDKNKDKAINQTRKRAYKYIVNESKKLSQNLQKTCIPTKISFDKNSHPIPPIRPSYRENMLMTKSISLQKSVLPLPKKENKEKIIVNYSITCY